MMNVIYEKKNSQKKIHSQMESVTCYVKCDL